MYGDVVSDEAAALVSSMVPTANIGADCAIFRPIHEAKLQIKEPGIVNPVPTILCGVMMLEHLGELEAAKVMRDGIKKVLGEQKIVVRENGGNNSTGEMVEAICNKIRG
jgi:isocitrate/isopropylmalate dehydrogenase